MVQYRQAELIPPCKACNHIFELISKMQELKIEIGDITPANIQQLKVINVSTLPVRYTDKFYNDLLALYGKQYMKFAVWHGFNIGAVCARVEKHETKEDFSKLYIMTINVIPAYRRRKIASTLLNHILEKAAKDSNILEVYLHVQTSNADAKQFYLSHGFIEIGIVENYYKRVDPTSAYILKKSLKDGHVVSMDYVKVDNSADSVQE